MKLALIRQRYNAYGGAERFVQQAIAALAAQSTDGGAAAKNGASAAALTLVAREWTAPSYGDGVARIQCNPFYLGRTWRDWSFARAARAATAGGAFDLVQSHERISGCDIYRAGDGVHAQWLENRARARGALANFAACLSPWHHYTLGAERRLFASAQLRAVICNSRMVADEIRARFGLGENKLRVIYNGVDTARFNPALKAQWRGPLRESLGIREGAFVHLLVGSGLERKGVPTLLRAARRLPADAHIVVVGADRKLDAYRARAAQAGEGARLHFAGAQQDIERWYAMADCFVLPTLYDPFPNAAMEALASGLPVITSRYSGAAELIEPAGCGWACDALDVDALGGLMARIIAPGVAADMGRKARALAEGYPLGGMAEQLLALYRELLSAS